MSIKHFFYDESAHSRKLTEITVNCDNFEPFFCTVIFGIEDLNIENFKLDFLKFEEKWKKSMD